MCSNLLNEGSSNISYITIPFSKFYFQSCYNKHILLLIISSYIYLICAYPMLYDRLNCNEGKWENIIFQVLGQITPDNIEVIAILQSDNQEWEDCLHQQTNTDKLSISKQLVDFFQLSKFGYKISAISFTRMKGSHQYHNGQKSRHFEKQEPDSLSYITKKTLLVAQLQETVSCQDERDHIFIQLYQTCTNCLV